MKKWILILLLSLPIGISGFAQQMEMATGYYIDLLQNRDVFFNRKLINPTNLSDSNKIIIDLVSQEQLMGITNSDNNFFISGETCIPSINSSFGLNFDFKKHNNFKNHSIFASYKYKLSLNSDSRFELGINLGLLQSKLEVPDLVFNQPDPIFNESSLKWVNLPVIDLGIAYKYKNQNFRLSFNNLVDSKIKDGSLYYIFRSKGFIGNYQAIYKVSKITLIPEIFGCIDSENKYGIFSFKLDYSEKLSGGLLYNTKDSFGFLISGLIKKRIKLGYFLERRETNNKSFGFHAINLGVILK